jgi:hypothetical protein
MSRAKPAALDMTNKVDWLNADGYLLNAVFS